MREFFTRKKSLEKKRYKYLQETALKKSDVQKSPKFISEFNMLSINDQNKLLLETIKSPLAQQAIIKE